MSDIHHTTVQAFRGADIAHILYKIKHNKASIYSKYTIVLIGTNDVASLKSVDDDMSLFQTLITRIRSKSSTNLFRIGERVGSVVECRTPEREVRGSRPTSAVLCP